MRRIMAAVLAALICFSLSMAAAEEKYKAMPKIFAVSVESTERKIDDNRSFVYKEYLNTTNKDVNEALKTIVDGFDEQLSPALKADAKKRGNRNSRLDVNIIYYRTGDRFISTMIQARNVYYREQLSILMTTRTYDLSTGKRILLTDLFDDSSAAWDILETGVKEQMESVYPEEKRDEEAINALCEPDALRQADFTLSGMELTLHYTASTVFEGKTNLIHVRFYYPQLNSMMTQTGIEATDNSRWKMVAITCDDGPKDYPSSYTLDAFRKTGARVTYFIVGKQLETYGDVFVKEMDQNHSFGTHTYNHWSGYTYKTAKRRLQEIDMSNELTLKLVGEKAAFFRAPGGTYPPWVESNIPMPIIQWSLDTYDYTGKSPQRILYSIRENLDEYDIILCHDTGNHLHDAVPLIAEYLESRGYMMVTLQELYAAQGMTPENNVVYWSFRPGENSNDRSHLGKK
jgi:peptidoglycan-N-acetylglucosamine deacetylase